jgi:hypothetical protein
MNNLFDYLKLKLIINFTNTEKKKSTTMGKIEYLRIFLNKEQQPVYISGESISGTVNFKINERLKINFVVLKIEGRGHVSW